MTMQPEDVKATRFREGWRGYDEDEVDDFMSRAAHALQVLITERDEARARADELSRDAEEVMENERLLRRTLLTAERTAEETVQRAENEAERILSDARAEAERIRIEAQDRARYELQQAAETGQRIREAIRDFRALRDEYQGRIHEVVREQLAAIDRVGDLPDLPDRVVSFEDLGVADPGIGAGDGSQPADGAAGFDGTGDQDAPPSVLSLDGADGDRGTATALAPSEERSGGSSRAPSEPA